MKRNQRAKFFCENCGTEVKHDAKFCNKCGKFFYSVRCPMCGKTGNQNEFINGCPKCGYAVGSENSFHNSHDTNTKNANTSVENTIRKNKNIFLGRRNSNYTTGKTGEDPLPIWIYILCFLAFVTIVAILLRFYLV